MSFLFILFFALSSHCFSWCYSTCFLSIFLWFTFLYLDGGKLHIFCSPFPFFFYLCIYVFLPAVEHRSVGRDMSSSRDSFVHALCAGVAQTAALASRVSSLYFLLLFAETKQHGVRLISANSDRTVAYVLARTCLCV